jgi:hypothetical protein
LAPELSLTLASPRPFPMTITTQFTQRAYGENILRLSSNTTRHGAANISMSNCKGRERLGYALEIIID